MKVTTLRLTDRLWRLLDEQARAEGTSASQLVREGAMMRLGYALGKEGRVEIPANGSPVSSRGAPFADFDAASGEVLDFLHGRLGFALWLVTRIERDQWVIEHARDEGYGVKAGDSFRFEDTYCSRMVEGEGPHFASETSAVPCYAGAAIGKQLPIASYLGVPLRQADGSLFGTLCAIDPAPQAPSVGDELPLLELNGRLLSSLLQKDALERQN